MVDIRAVYKQFSPAPLGKGQENLYVNLDTVRGSAGLVSQMARKIRLSDEPTCQVITGHRGSGKSTELWRLATELAQPESGNDGRYAVVTLRAMEALDPNDVDVPELILAIVRQLAETLRADPYRIELKPGYFQQLLPRLSNAMQTEIQVTGGDLSTPLGSIGIAVKNSPDARDAVRKALEPRTGTLLLAANDVIGEAAQKLAEGGWAGLVVIVDDLDKMITRLHPQANFTTTEYLFVHRAPQLTGLTCHMIYSIPIELACSTQGPTIVLRYGTLHVVPMTKVTGPPPDRQPHEDGIGLLEEVVRRRAQAAGTTLEGLFQPGKLRELILFSGGQPTELMTMIREAMITAGVPIGDAGIKRCRTEAERGYGRMLRKEHLPLLREIAKKGRATRSDASEPILRELLASRAVLLYRNDEEWYDLNPAVRNLL